MQFYRDDMMPICAICPAPHSLLLIGEAFSSANANRASDTRRGSPQFNIPVQCADIRRAIADHLSIACVFSGSAQTSRPASGRARFIARVRESAAVKQDRSYRQNPPPIPVRAAVPSGGGDRRGASVVPQVTYIQQMLYCLRIVPPIRLPCVKEAVSGAD